MWHRPRTSNPRHVGGEGGLYALDAHTGRVRWTFRNLGFANSTPVLVGGTMYIGSQDDSIDAVDAGTGQLRWRYPTDRQVVSGVTVAGGRVFAGDDSGAVDAVDAGRSGAIRPA